VSTRNRPLAALRPTLLPALLALAALVPFHGACSTTRIFFVRDLSSYFWPHHLWLRQSLAEGHVAVWDPNPALGYPMAPEAALQFFFVPTLPLRVLLPDVVAFNVWVALPFPLGALGLYVFLRRHASPGAAALGGLAFALAGPVLSTSTTPNLAWATALAPWVLWGVDRLADGITGRRVAAAAAVFGCDLLAGEPGLSAATAGMAVLWILCGRPAGEAQGPGRRRLVAATLGVLVLGLLIAAVQLLPLLEATGRSIRGAGWLRDSWPLHPLRLLETVLPGVFGNYLGVPTEVGPWLAPLNSGREPYLFSVYLGPVVLMLACAGSAGRPGRRWALFWGSVTVLALLASFGDATPFYPALQAVMPWLKAFRYPSKFMVLVALGLAALAARGWDHVGEAGGGRWAARAGLTLGTAALVVLVVNHGLPDLVRALAESLGLRDPSYGARFLSPLLGGGALRLALLAAVGLACLRLAASPSAAPRSRRALAGAAALDLLAAGSHLNPTLNAGAFREPPWVAATRAHRDDRVFIAQDLMGSGEADDDHPPRLEYPSDRPIVQIKALYSAVLPQFPSVWGVRESLSSDVSGLQSREYLTLLEAYQRSGREARTQFLRRVGTRYHVLPRPPSPEAREILALPRLAPLALYEDRTPAPRVAIVPRAVVEPDANTQVKRLFDAAFDPSREVLVEREPAPAGLPGPGGPPITSILDEQPTRLTVAARVPDGGAYLVLLDRYDPHWLVQVDGVAAPLLRANGLVRAVRLTAGEHRLVFYYRYPAFLWGAVVSLTTAVILAAVAWLSGRRAAPAEARHGPW
jgi:hypothetical protein